MSKKTSNPLESLSLSGLSNLQEEVKESKRVLENAAPELTLGPLEMLPGTWVGPGFNIIEIPNMNQIKPGPPPPDKFKVIVNSTSETLTFTPIDGEIINRGNAQQDIAYLGLHYIQQVIDINLPAGRNGIHLETGLFLNLPNGTDPNVDVSVARLASIPHGDSLLAQGSYLPVEGGRRIKDPIIDDVDATPFTVNENGERVNDTSVNYLAEFAKTPLPEGVTIEDVMNPNRILRKHIEGQNIIDTIVIFLDANPIKGIGNVTAPTGGITNIPFINVNANANSLTAIFWIETVQNGDGSTFLQLQYTQTVILDFPVFGAPPGNKVEQIKWPHISVATLRKQL